MKRESPLRLLIELVRSKSDWKFCLLSFLAIVVPLINLQSIAIELLGEILGLKSVPI